MGEGGLEEIGQIILCPEELLNLGPSGDKLQLDGQLTTTLLSLSSCELCSWLMQIPFGFLSQVIPPFPPEV